jgi:hypothetical protein
MAQMAKRLPHLGSVSPSPTKKKWKEGRKERRKGGRKEE